MAYLPEVKDMRRAAPFYVLKAKRQPTVSVEQLRAEYATNSKAFKKKKEPKPWQKAAMRCNPNYSLQQCRRNETDRAFYGN